MTDQPSAQSDSTQPDSTQPAFDKKRLRQNMRLKRQLLSVGQQRLAARKLAVTLKRSPLFLRSTRVAIYLANDGEINPQFFIESLWKCNKQCYLPVLHPVNKKTLWFYRYTKQSRLKKNRFGIPEPTVRGGSRTQPWVFDLVLFPLVAFDCEGGRLGMGGGFYDRTFSFITKQGSDRKPDKPKLYGLSHQLQQVEKLPTEPWDIPLDGIATDRRLYQCRSDC